jgi:hypothetical protein
MSDNDVPIEKIADLVGHRTTIVTQTVYRHQLRPVIEDFGAVVTSYRPMTLADLGRRLASVDDAKTRWKLVWEFLEEYRWEPDNVQPSLLCDEPPVTGDERWDVLLAALAEYLAAQHDRAAPEWTEIRVLQRPWFPAELEVQRADALVWAPAAFRKHGVYLSARDLEAA